MIKKFESFDDDLDQLKIDVEILMEDLIDSLGLIKHDLDNDDWCNGHYEYKVVRNESLLYNFAVEDPFDKTPSNNVTIKNTLDKIKFIQSLVEGISKVTARLDNLGYKWSLINDNGDNEMAFYIHL